MTLDPRRPVDDLRLLSDRLRAIEDRLDRLAAPSGTQAARSVATLQAEIAKFDAAAQEKTTLFSDSGGFSTGYSLYSFDSDDDPSVTVTTTTGNVVVTASARLFLSNSDASTLFFYLHPECVGVDTITGASPALLLSSEVATNLQFGGSFSRFYQLTPGTYTFRLRRARALGTAGGTQAVASTSRLIFAQSIP